MTLGKNLEQLRCRNHLSQEDLAKALGITADTVFDWETDQAAPNLDMLMALSKLFHVSVDRLLYGCCGDSDSFKQAKIKWSFVYIAVYSVMLWVGGVVMLIYNHYLSLIPGLEGQLSNFSGEIELLSIAVISLSLFLFVFNLIRLRNKKRLQKTGWQLKLSACFFSSVSYKYGKHIKKDCLAQTVP